MRLTPAQSQIAKNRPRFLELGNWFVTYSDRRITFGNLKWHTFALSWKKGLVITLDPYTYRQNNDWKKYKII